MTKRYILLVGNHYYPNRWDDFAGTFDSVDEAKEAASHLENDDSIYSRDYMWAQVIDSFTMQLIWES